MVNRSEVRACMGRKGLRDQETANLLDIPITTFRRKMQGKSLFTERDIDNLASRLGVNPIFLIGDGSKNDQKL